MPPLPLCPSWDVGDEGVMGEEGGEDVCKGRGWLQEGPQIKLRMHNYKLERQISFFFFSISISQI